LHRWKHYSYKRSTVIPTEYLHNLRRKGDLSSSQEIPMGEQQKSQTTRITCQPVRNYWSDCPQNQVQRVSLHDDVMVPFLLRLFYKIIFSYVPLTDVCDCAVYCRLCRGRAFVTNLGKGVTNVGLGVAHLGMAATKLG
jgi:hypothetical protein